MSESKTPSVRPPTRLEALAFPAALAAGLFMIATTLYAVLAFRHIVFPWDMWDTVDLYRAFRDGQGSWSGLWALHNEHRILFPRLLILADYFATGASGNLLLVALFGLHVAHAALLVRAFSQSGAGTRRGVLLYACIVAMGFFWLKQRENFIWPFQVAWMLNAFFTSLAAWCAATRPTGRGLLAAAVCCVVGSLSLASGVVMPFVIGVMLWRAGVPRVRLAAWAAFAVLLTALYVAGYAPQEKVDGQMSPTPFAVLAFAGAYLGNGLIMAQLPVAVAVVVGFGGLILFGWQGVRFLRQANTSPYARFAFAVAAYVVAMVLVTSWGRASFGLPAAGANRYVTTSVVFWVVLFGWLASQAAPRSRRLLFIGAFAICFGYLIPTQLVLTGKMRAKFVAYEEASLALIAGVEDSAALYELYPENATLWRSREILRQDHLSVYKAAWARAVGGEAVGEPVLPGDGTRALTVVIDEVRPVARTDRSGLFVRGRLEGGEGGLTEVVLLTRGDVVAGAATTTHRGCSGCFSGYVSGSDPEFGAVAWTANGPSSVRAFIRR